MQKLLAVLSCLFVLVVACSKATGPLPALTEVPNLETRLTPDEAYRAIPHRRTKIDLSESTLEVRDRQYVELMLATLDQAIALRVTTLMDFRGGKSGKGDLDNYTSRQDRLIAFVERLAPPAFLDEYHRHILEALRSQRGFFVAWNAAGDSPDIRSHPKVQASSGALHAAYSALAAAVASKAPGNDEALFDYHCALDFI